MQIGSALDPQGAAPEKPFPPSYYGPLKAPLFQATMLNTRSSWRSMLILGSGEGAFLRLLGGLG